MENLLLNKREKGAHNQVRRERKSGLVPGIIYGKNVLNTMFEIGQLELDKEIQKNGEHGVFNVNLDGQVHKTLIKDIQRDPVKHKIIHIDLEEVSENEMIQTNVPIVFLGEELVTRRGGIVQKEKTTVKVHCKGNDIPKNVNVDLSKLKVGDSFRIGDVEISQDISFVEDVKSIIASITDNNKAAQVEEMKDDLE